jgi:hypothetical protein
LLVNPRAARDSRDRLRKNPRQAGRIRRSAIYEAPKYKLIASVVLASVHGGAGPRIHSHPRGILRAAAAAKCCAAGVSRTNSARFAQAPDAQDLADASRVIHRLRTAMLCATLAATSAGAMAASDPIALLAFITEPAERSKAAAGSAVLTVVPARGRDLAVYGVVRTAAGPDRLVEWTRAIEQLYQGRFAPALGRFSDPPQLADLTWLTLDEEDVNDLRACRAGACGVKLSAEEMERIRQAATSGGPEWRPAVQDAFRRVLLRRAQEYLASGLGGSLPYEDHRQAESPHAEFEEVAARIGFDELYDPRVMSYLRAYPLVHGSDIESFLYWSKETLGGGKPIVSVTHVAVFRTFGEQTADVVIAARQVFATHYLTGSLSLTAIAAGAGGTPGHLIYIRRARTDSFDGPFGKLVRHVVERRIRADGPPVLETLRRKLEGGTPTGTHGSD